MLLPGCAADFCIPADGSRQTLIVNPAETGRNGTANQMLYGTIQEALDAASIDVPTTVCVASGTYYEQLTVRANTHLLGEATGDVFVRPPQTDLGVLPSAVDRTLLTVESAVDRPITVQRLDVGAAGICADISGDGSVALEDVRLTGCGLGLRATGGSLSVLRSPIKNHTVQGALLRGLDRAEFVDGELFHNGSDVQPGTDVTDYERAAVLSGVSLGGSLVAVDVADLVLSGMLVDGAAWTDALVSLERGALKIADTRVDLRGLARGGTGAAFITIDADVDIDRLTLHGQGHGLLHATGADRSVRVSNLSWRDDQPLEDPDEPGERPAIVQLDLSSTDPDDPEDPDDVPTGESVFEARHLSINASSPTVVFGVGADDLKLLVFNSVLWNVGEGNAIQGPDTVGLGFGHVLTDDGLLEGDNLIGPDHVDFFTPGFGGTRHNVPAIDGPVRCRGANLSNQRLDLLGNPRPFDDGEGTFKLPDLGAVELQEPCP